MLILWQGNLESLLSNTSPYMSEEKALGGEPHCNGPSTYLDALKYAGFDALSNANNHITDNGERGLLQTMIYYKAMLAIFVIDMT